MSVFVCVRLCVNEQMGVCVCVCVCVNEQMGLYVGGWCVFCVHVCSLGGVLCVCGGLYE